MAILQACCCWQSVRKGSYASAIYTMSYFSISCYIMTVTVLNDKEYYMAELNVTNILTKNETTNNKPKNVSFLEPMEISYVTMVFYLVVIFFSILGVLSSILVLVGLYFEIKWLLIPWIFIIPLSSCVDISHSVYWLTLDDPSFNPLTGILFTLELFIFVLNIYCLLCVISQYQEYKAGRGTAAHYIQESLHFEEQPSLSVTGNQQPTATSYLTTNISQLNRTFGQSPGEYSVCEDSVALDPIKRRRVQFLNTSNEKEITQIDIDPESMKNDFPKYSSEEGDIDNFYNGKIHNYLWCTPADKKELSEFQLKERQRLSKKRRSLDTSQSEKKLKKLFKRISETENDKRSETE